MVDSIARASQIQALTLAEIHSKYQTAQRPDIFTMTFKDFMEEWERAYSEGTQDEFNARYAELLTPFIQMAMSGGEQNG